MKESTDSVAETLVKLTRAKDTSLKALSIKIGKNHAYLHQFVTRGTPRILPEDARAALGAYFNLPPDTFREGGSDTSSVELNLAGEEFLPVPIYDIRASAGPGSLIEDGEPISHQIFRGQWLSSLTRAPISALAVIEVSGDSMEPTLANRDTILVNRNVEKVREDGIYVLFYDDALLVKRCSRNLEDGSVVVTSDNPLYRDQILTNVDVLRVIGRVIWIGRALG